MKEEKADENADRRDFLLKAGSACATCALVGVPAGAGITVMLDPLKHTTGVAEFLPVAPFDAIPEDGTPQRFTIRADKEDAWSRFPNQVIGAVYLRKLGGEKLQAFNVVCPHLGCAINYREDEKDYFCPCHNSAFELETGAQEANSPSARGMDSLETKIDKDGQVLVKFQNFQMGKAEKIPV